MMSTAAPTPILSARGVWKHFGGVEVLKGISLSIQPGSVTCLLGPSGSGKTTFLRCINHLEVVSRGQIYVDGELVGYRRVGDHLQELPPKEIARNRAKIGMVFQRFNLFPHLTVIQNIIEAPIGVKGEESSMAKDHALQLLRSVGLEEKANEYPNRLSGGQQQRVAIARALAMRPKLMLFDEPTSALDPELVGEVLDVMRDLAIAGMSMLVVTHEIGFARDVADTVVFMDHGRIVESGPPAELIDNPSHPRTQAFLGRIV
jgi:polar amino acid transport system ATP-binding protein